MQPNSSKILKNYDNENNSGGLHNKFLQRAIPLNQLTISLTTFSIHNDTQQNDIQNQVTQHND